MNFRVKYWLTEEHRDEGLSDIYAYYQKPEEAIAMANKLFYREPIPCVEVENDKEETIYHISTDIPKGEHYQL